MDKGKKTLAVSARNKSHKKPGLVDLKPGFLKS